MINAGGESVLKYEIWFISKLNSVPENLGEKMKKIKVLIEQ